MKFIRTLITINLLLAAVQSHAQNKLVVHENKRVQLLCNQRDSLTICSFPGTGKCCGYRILVAITTDRDAAYHLKNRLLERYPNYSVSMSFQTSHFKLKLGNFLFEPEASAFNTRLNFDLKISTFVVPDMIYKPAEKQKIYEQPCTENNVLPLYTRR